MSQIDESKIFPIEDLESTALEFAKVLLGGESQFLASLDDAKLIERGKYLSIRAFKLADGWLHQKNDSYLAYLANHVEWEELDKAKHKGLSGRYWVVNPQYNEAVLATFIEYDEDNINFEHDGKTIKPKYFLDSLYTEYFPDHKIIPKVHYEDDNQRVVKNLKK